MAQLKHPKMVDIRDILDENTRLPALVAASAEKLLGLERLNKAYDKIVRDKESGSQENFFQLASRHLNLKLQLRPGDLEIFLRKGLSSSLPIIRTACRTALCSGSCLPA